MDTIQSLLLTLCRDRRLATINVQELVDAIHDDKPRFVHTSKTLDRNIAPNPVCLTEVNNHMVCVVYNTHKGCSLACITVWPKHDTSMSPVPFE